MGNPIPQEARNLVELRDFKRCLRCSGKGSEWHHRRSRRVRDEHQHCTCNGMLLCGTCHRWVHAHPFEARRFGFVVSSHESFPGNVPVLAHFSMITLDCKGTYEWAPGEGPDTVGPSE